MKRKLEEKIEGLWEFGILAEEFGNIWRIWERITGVGGQQLHRNDVEAFGGKYRTKFVGCLCSLFFERRWC